VLLSGLGQAILVDDVDAQDLQAIING
jgi:hypothetical protein